MVLVVVPPSTPVNTTGTGWMLMLGSAKKGKPGVIPCVMLTLDMGILSVLMSGTVTVMVVVVTTKLPPWE